METSDPRRAQYPSMGYACPHLKGYPGMKKRVVVALAVIAFLYTSLSFVGAAFAMRIPRLPLVGSPASVGLTYQDASFPARSDGTVLKGWYIPAGGQSAIMVVHGGFQNRVDEVVDTLGLARDLAARGYDLLLFDLRGRGESEGRGRALSNIEPDIGGAVDFLKGKGFSEESMGIVGFCSGAAAAAIYTGGNGVGALVLDGCFTTVDGMVVAEAIAAGIPRFLVRAFIPGLTVTTRIMYGFVQADPVDVVPHVGSPILFIHEENDTLVSREDTSRLFMASDNPANEIWEVSSVEHSRAYRTYPTQYVERLDSFFSRSLTRREP
jgi:pimeloyl-ACP methyl ester carboxylesterase